MSKLSSTIQLTLVFAPEPFKREHCRLAGVELNHQSMALRTFPFSLVPTSFLRDLCRLDHFEP
jgi:hypothetical protein